MRIRSALFITLALCGIIAVDAPADVLITEVLADNENGLRDEDGDRQDWIELYNSGEQAVSLDGWWLTDKPATPALWRLPAVSLAPNACLLIWASGKNRDNPARPLHTSFSLAKGGEYLALFRPDPETGVPLLADAIEPSFPALPPDVSYGKLFEPASPPTAPAWTGASGFFSAPTPGEENGAGTAGPLLFNAAPEDPDVPRPLGTPASPPLTVTVRAIPTLHAVRAVRVIPRVLFQPELAAVAMADDGIAPDTVAGDGTYAVQLPTGALTAGQMFRWRFEVEDETGTVTRLPAFSDPLDAPQYFGTVAVVPATAASQLPVLEWFVQNAPAYGPTTEPFRGCCYYLSNFYDNVGHMIHGQTTATFPKKSYDFDFTGEDRFLWRADARRVKDINLLTNYADKTKARNHLSHWMAQMSGTPHHFVVPVRVQLNGVFHGVMDLVEDSDDRMLERNGLDPEGALYKIYGTTVALAEKKTRKEEDKSDIAALYAGLSRSLPLHERLIFTYDNVDVAALINYRVTRLLNGDADIGEKNYCLYRDTNGTRDWQPIMWDVDLTHGHNWSDTLGYFDDALTTTIFFHAGGLKSLLYDIAYHGPEFQQMFVRRLRTLMDRVLQAPGTLDGLMEQQLRAVAASIDPDPADPSPWTDGDLDAARWGFHANYAPNRPREEVERVIAGYLAPRRAFLFNTGTGRPAYNGVPIPDAPQVNAPGMVTIDALDFLPVSGSQAEEYVILRNTTAQAVDLSGWSLEGEVRHTFKGGTVIPPGAGTPAANYVGLLHVAKDAKAFRARAVGPTGGQRRFVQGNYQGQLSARGGTVILRDDAGQVIATRTYAGAPTAAQQRLRVTELQYHPADPTPAEASALVGVTADDFEYVELINLGTTPLDLTGAWFSEGIAFTFPATSVGAYQRIVVAKNPVAFAVRYPSVSAPVLGPYSGFLDNAGERLELKDACGETVFDFTYKDGWYPHTDGTGRSLVVRDPVAPQDGMLGEAVTWGICNTPLGTPGASDATVAQAYHGWDHFNFTAAQRDDPLVGGPYADPDGDGRVNWAEYALGCDPWTPDERPLGFALVTYAKRRYASVAFDRPSNALDVQYTVLATGDLQWELFSPVGSALYQTVPLGDGRETVTLRETTTATAPRRFLKLRVDFTP